MRGLLRTYFPPLPRSVLTLQAGGLVNSFGNGMVIPFMFIYLHNVRGIELGGVWIAAAALCAAGAVCTLFVEGALPTRARRTPLPAAASA